MQALGIVAAAPTAVTRPRRLCVPGRIRRSAGVFCGLAVMAGPLAMCPDLYHLFLISEFR
jgi:hypothetical protein